jgi:hypothetical protein
MHQNELYSYRLTSVGSIFAARRARAKLATTESENSRPDDPRGVHDRVEAVRGRSVTDRGIASCRFSY